MSRSSSSLNISSGSSTRKSGDGIGRLISRSRNRSNRMKSHTCELLPPSDKDKTKLSQSAWYRLQSAMLKSILVAGNNRRCFSYLRSSAAVNLEEDRQLLSPHWLVIHPFSHFRLIWQCIMCVALFYYCTVFPVALAFVSPKLGPTYSFGWYFLIHVIDFIFFVEICLNFRTGIVDTRTKDIILDPWIISRSYVRGTFAIDLLTALPLDAALYFADGDWFNPTLGVVTILSLSNYYRVRQFITYLEELFEVAGISSLVFNLVGLITKYFIFLHWAACAGYLVPVIMHGEDLPEIDNSWIVQYNLVDAGLGKLYSNAINRVMSVSLKLGYGRYIDDETGEDSIVTVCVLIIGFFFNAAIFAVFLHFLATRYVCDLKFQSTMIQLKEYMTYKKLPTSTQTRMFMYYENKFMNGYFKESAILATLSESIRDEISMHCCERLVAQVEIFSGLPPATMSAIISKLHPEIYLPTDVIVKAGLPGDCMFFLQIGTAAVYTATGKEVCHLQDGDYFGEVALTEKNSRRVASVVAIDICDAYRLDRSDYLDCIAKYPDLLEKVERLSRGRQVECLELETEYKRELAEYDVT